MKKTFPKILLILILINFNLYSQPEKAKKALSNAVQSSNSTGRLFYIAIPPNELTNYPTQSLDIFVTSSYDTKVILSNPATGIYITKKVVKNKVTTFSSTDGDIDWGRDEIRISQNPQQQGMRLEADEPISVYVMNSKVFTTDGYLAIPTTMWGTRYIHLSYWDFYEFSPGWATGFLVLASEDNTKVTIQLKGRGAGFATTDRGSKIGQSLKFTLRKGEVYLVRGDAKTRGVFDLSGSEITSNKRVGMISFHERCMIPVTTVTNGRDNMIEMMPPVSAWGKNYYSVELDRKTDYGDYFRVVASEDTTKVRVRWYDKKDGKLLGDDTRILKKAGDFEEYQDNQATFPHAFPSVRGTSAFEADKPILVMQYAYSSNWDGGSSWWDPFMSLVVPREQFTTNSIFQTPSNKSGNEYNNNFFNMIVIGDTLNSINNDKLLSSISLDGKRLIDTYPNLSKQRIPNTDLYWATVKVEKGAHQIFGDTPFGGFIYGYSTNDTYGWPAAMAFRKLDNKDFEAPKVEYQLNCDGTTSNGVVTDMPNDSNIRSNLSDVYLVTGSSYNYKFTFDNIIYGTTVKANWSLVPIDKFKEAKAVLVFRDVGGNDTTITIEYLGSVIKIDSIGTFGDFKRYYPPLVKDVTIKNNSTTEIYFSNIKFKYGNKGFTLEPIKWDTTQKIAVGDSRIVSIKFTVDVSLIGITDNNIIDSLGVGDGCSFNYLVATKATLLKELKDVNPPLVVIGSSNKCNGIFSNCTITDKPNDTIIRSNLKEVVLDSSTGKSYNYKLIVGNIIKGVTSQTTFSLIPIDALQDSKATVIFRDVAGNDTTIVFTYIVSKFNLSKNLEYGNFKTTDDLIAKRIYVKNESNKVVIVKDLKLQKGNIGFSLEPLSWDKNIAIAIGDSRPVLVTFNPSVAYKNSKTNLCIDSLGVGDDCAFNYKIKVEAIIDKINDVETSANEYFSIDAIIPNPITNEGGIIQYSIGKEAKIDISIVTVLGSKFVLIENQTLQTGKYTLDIPINKLSNGSYFVELKADGVVISKKFIIIK